MTIKSSISLGDTQHAFARQLVDDGKFPTVSAVIQHSLSVLQDQLDAQDADRRALKAILAKRAAGPFISMDDFSTRLDDMIAEKRRDRGLDG